MSQVQQSKLGKQKSRSRRHFLTLGAAAISTLGLSGCGGDDPAESKQEKKFKAGEKETSLNKASISKKWKSGKGKAYEQGSFAMPGVCKLPGPQAKRNWPDRNKYKNTTTVPGMCQLCSTICGIVGHVKDGRLIKIEGNPKDPNSRGKLCARGHAALNHLYHPERLLYPLKRVGKRGEGKWKRISWEDALTEIATSSGPFANRENTKNSHFIRDDNEVKMRSKDF